MAIICLNCGNTQKFTQVHNLSEWATETAIIDGETESTDDYTDYEVTDSETIDYGKMTCAKCDETNCEEGLDKNGILEVQWKHTNRKGKWSPNELPEDERNVKLGDKLLLIKL